MIEIIIKELKNLNSSAMFAMATELNIIKAKNNYKEGLTLLQKFGYDNPTLYFWFALFKFKLRSLDYKEENAKPYLEHALSLELNNFQRADILRGLDLIEHDYSLNYEIELTDNFRKNIYYESK